MIETIHVSATDLTIAALLLLLPGLASVVLKLGLGRKLLLASVRTVLQLSFLGYVLHYIFALSQWFWVIGLLLVMLTLAARAAIGRTSYRFKGATWLAFVCLVVACGVVTFATTEWVLDVEPWFAPRYVLPLAGMLLGNALTGISLGLDQLLKGIVQQRGRIESSLCHGATPRQALTPFLREAVRTGMIPILNSMMIVGIVSMPGMMTGQLLAGAEPLQAVSYQIMIMFMIAAATVLGVVLICYLAAARLVHPMQRVRWELIKSVES